MDKSVSALFKFWLFLFALWLFSALFVKGAHSEDMLVEPSLAYEKKATPMKDFSMLFSQLGMTPPEQGTVEPCIDLQNHTKKYCTVHSMKALLDEHVFVPIEDRILREFLKSNEPCGQLAEYIGRVCKLNNFGEIIKHFALQK